MHRLLPGMLLLILAMSVAGCDDSTSNTPNTPTTPSTPTTPTTTETFTGTLNKNGGITFPFTATAAGTVAVTLSSVAPDATLQIGLSLGTWTGTACQVVIANDAAAQNAIVTGTLTAAASLCVRVYDATEKVNTAVDFTVSVVHP
jgi:hypothetical protein